METGTRVQDVFVDSWGTVAGPGSTPDLVKVEWDEPSEFDDPEFPVSALR